MYTPNPLNNVVKVAELNRAAWLNGHGGKDSGSIDLCKGWLVPLPKESKFELFPLHEGRSV